MPRHLRVVDGAPAAGQNAERGLLYDGTGPAGWLYSILAERIEAHLPGIPPGEDRAAFERALDAFTRRAARIAKDAG